MLRHTSRTAAVLGSLLILVLAAAAPAAGHHKPAHEKGPSVGGNGSHPSGKDRSIEPGGSGTQGKSPSTPDQNGKGPERDEGGTDKPGGPGGADPTDQDGNNGCGNDTDFDDDNEGWCGGRPRAGIVVTEPPGQQGGGDLPGPEVGDTTGTEIDTDTDIEGESGAQVLGVFLQAATGGEEDETAGGTSELATTGIPASALAAISLVLLTAGTGLVLVNGRRRRGEN